MILSVLALSLTYAFCLPFDHMAYALEAETDRLDLNRDNTVSVADAVLLLRFVTEDTEIKPLQNADLNADGVITLLDVNQLLRVLLYPLGQEPEFIVTETTAIQQTQTTETQTQTTVSGGFETNYIEHLKTLPAYNQQPYVTVNQNLPYFNLQTTHTTAFEYYSPLDALGRCGMCEAYIGTELMPTENRGSISAIKPTGWQLVRYDGIVDGNYLYNRCHLIGYQLTGENANINNLITGTRYLNVTGMLPFENMTANYIESTGNHVYYRVTPYFENRNLVASGVLMEAYSMEDQGEGVCFNVFCYNVQPRICIDYTDGSNYLLENNDEPSGDCRYIVNKSTKKFHLPECSSVTNMDSENKWDYTGSREYLIDLKYEPCKRCNP